MDENILFGNLYNKHQEIINSGIYSDYLYQLEVQLSTFTVLSYEDFVKTLKAAAKIIQSDAPIYQHNADDCRVINLLHKSDVHQSIKKIDRIRFLIDMIIRTTPIAIPVLRKHFGRMVNSLRCAICYAVEHEITEYSPWTPTGRAWDSIKHFQKLTQQELPNLMELTCEDPPDQKTALESAGILVDKYENWQKAESTDDLNGLSIMAYQRAVICHKGIVKRFENVMNYLLCIEDIDSINKICRIHGQLWDEILHSPSHYQTEYNSSPIITPDMHWEVTKLATAIREVISKHKNTTPASLGNQDETPTAAQPEGWKSPEGYIGSKDIEHFYKVPRSTLQGWAEKDNPKTEEDTQTKEKYFPEDWFKERFKKYTPKRKS